MVQLPIHSMGKTLTSCLNKHSQKEKVFQHSVATELCLLFGCEAWIGKLWLTLQSCCYILPGMRTILFKFKDNYSLTDKKFNPSFRVFNPIALRKAKVVYNFGLSECSRVKGYTCMSLTLQVSWSDISGRG